MKVGVADVLGLNQYHEGLLEVLEYFLVVLLKVSEVTEGKLDLAYSGVGLASFGDQRHGVVKKGLDLGLLVGVGLIGSHVDKDACIIYLRLKVGPKVVVVLWVSQLQFNMHKCLQLIQLLHPTPGNIKSGRLAVQLITRELPVIHLIESHLRKEVSQVLYLQDLARLRTGPQAVKVVLNLSCAFDFNGVVAILHFHYVTEDLFELLFVELFVVHVVRVADPLKDLQRLQDAVAEEAGAQVLDSSLEGVVIDVLLLVLGALAAPPALFELDVAFGEDADHLG